MLSSDVILSGYEGTFGIVEKKSISHERKKYYQEVIKLMRSNLKKSSFKTWRKRVSGRKLKHGFPEYKTRFKSSKQKFFSD